LSLSSLETTLGLLKIDCVSFQDPVSGISSYRQNDFDVVISDVKMPLMNGVELMKTVHRMNPSAKVILISGSYTNQAKLIGRDNEAYAFFRKPIHISRLVNVLKEIESENQKQLN